VVQKQAIRQKGNRQKKKDVTRVSEKKDKRLELTIIM
jgi:hypothetical protein